MASTFSTAYAEILAGLRSNNFSKNKEWHDLVQRARKLTQPSGFDAGQSSVTDDLRKTLIKATSKGSNEAIELYAAAGEDLSGKGAGVVINNDLAKRLGALKTLRHTYLLKKSGAHKVWVVSLPGSFRDWPHDALKGGLSSTTQKLVDNAEHFTLDDRKNLGEASQEALRWVHKAMMVTGAIKKNEHFEIVARWFADSSSKDSDVENMAATLNAGLKKIAFTLKSGSLIYTDSVSERGTAENQGVEAFVWGDALDVVYIEEEFFGTRNTLSGLTNWARIVVHELSHREVKTQDHAYEHQYINPKKLTAAKAIDNADSWAWFCADCAGMLTKGNIQNAMAR